MFQSSAFKLKFAPLDDIRNVPFPCFWMTQPPTVKEPSSMPFGWSYY